MADAALPNAALPNAIEVENLTKVFLVLHRQTSLLGEALKLLLLRFPRRERFVALHDLSFTVPRGTTVGVIGRNGSGKSTLLALLANIYRPTSGRVTVRGRVATLLALGAGFHDEFTGIENIFLNGTILGF